MLRGAFLLSIFLASLHHVAHGQVCNAFNPLLIENDVNYPQIEAANFTVIFPAVLNAGEVTLVSPDVDDGTGGVAATFWHTENRRIADGFKASFTWEYSGNSDGIAFVVQNDKVQDIEGNGGAGLGFFNGLNRYIAVGIDVCPQLGRSSRYPCDANSDVLVSVSGQGVFPAPVLNFGSAQASRSLFPRDTAINIEVFYLQDLNMIAVFTDGTELINATLTGFTDVETHFGSRFGTFGFTASNRFEAVDAGTVKVSSFRLDKFISEIRPSTAESAQFPRKVILGKQTVIDIVVVDSCNLPSGTRAAELNVTADKITAYLEAQTASGPFQLFADQISNPLPGVFAAAFIMPSNILADWTLFADVASSSGAVEMQGVPIVGAVTTVNQIAPALPLYALILLISLLVILVLAMVYVIRRLYRYRIKLKENEEDIAFGREKREMDKLDATVTYTMNPLMGDLNEMQLKLEKNQKILADLRKGDTMVENIDATVAQLKKQNKELRKQLKDLKIKEQKQDAMKNRQSLRKYGGKRAVKQEFSQERA